DSGSVALNWSPTPYFSIAPTRCFDRSWLSEEPSSPQTARPKTSTPAAATATRRSDLRSMELPPMRRFGGDKCANGGPLLPLDGAEHDAADEVALDEGVDGQDRKHGQHD